MTIPVISPVPIPPWLHSRLGQVNGATIRVGIVDSGFDRQFLGAGPDVQDTVDVTLPESPRTRVEDGDPLRHGTACLTTAFRIAPGAAFVPIRIFSRSLFTSVPALCRAIRWATDCRLDVLNLSLRAEFGDPLAEDLYHACAAACRAHVIIVASSKSDGRPCLPAWFDNAIAVETGSQHDPFDFDYREEGPIEIAAASGIDGHVLWRGGEKKLAEGPSYSAPVVSGIVALVRERYRNASVEEIRSILAELSIKQRGASRVVTHSVEQS